MAITDKETGVWSLDQVYNKINQGSIWTYSNVAQLWSWGYDREGGMGRSVPAVNYSSPIQVGGDKKYAFGTRDPWMGMGVQDGALWIWGTGDYGVLAQNNTTAHLSPIQVGSDTTWSKVAQGIYQYPYAYGIKTDGTLWSWGNNAYGQMGVNDRNVHRSSPTQIPGTTWGYISAGYGPIATKTDGTLWVWAANYGGVLGQNQAYPGLKATSSPTQIPGTTWSSGARKSVRGGGSSGSVAAIKTDGTLWTWGLNTNGQLAQNNRTEYSSPIQIPGTSWDKVSMSGYSTVAVKTDGTLWVWGENLTGQLGLNQPTNTHYSSPVQIPGTTWNDVFVSSRHMMATKSDGTMYAWGRNSTGQLGQNNVTYYSSPVQIPGTKWSSENVNYNSNRDSSISVFNFI